MPLSYLRGIFERCLAYNPNKTFWDGLRKMISITYLSPYISTFYEIISFSPDIIIIDIIHSTTNGASRQGRPRGGEATEWHPREPQAPEGKGTATLKFCTATELKCWGL